MILSNRVNAIGIYGLACFVAPLFLVLGAVLAVEIVSTDTERGVAAVFATILITVLTSLEYLALRRAIRTPWSLTLSDGRVRLYGLRTFDRSTEQIKAIYARRIPYSPITWFFSPLFTIFMMRDVWKRRCDVEFHFHDERRSYCRLHWSDLGDISRRLRVQVVGSPDIE